MKTMKKLFILTIIMMVTATFAFAEGQQEGGADKAKKTVDLVYVNWKRVWHGRTCSPPSLKTRWAMRST